MCVAKYTEDPRLQTGYSFVPEMTSEERRASLNLCGPHVMDFIVPLASSMASVFGETKKTRFNRRYIYIYINGRRMTQRGEHIGETIGVIDVGEDIISISA